MFREVMNLQTVFQIIPRLDSGKCECLESNVHRTHFLLELEDKKMFRFKRFPWLLLNASY